MKARMQSITKRLRAAAGAVLLLAAVSSARADVLAGWSFAGLSNYGPSPMAATTTGANVTVGGLTRGSGVSVNGTAGANTWGGSGWDGPTNLEQGVATNHFATFSVTAATGYTLSLSSIDPYNIRRSSTGPDSGQWQYQVGNGEFVNIGSGITWGTNTSSSGNTQAAIDLSGIAALQNVAAGTTVTFRVVNYDVTTVGGIPGPNGTWYFNGGGPGLSLNVNGSTALAGPVLNDTVIAAISNTVALGRVMQTAPNAAGNVTLNKTGGNSTTYSAAVEGDASVEASGSFAAGSQSEQITVGVDRSTTGVKNGTVTIDNQATTSNAAGQGSADPDKVINVSATVLADRVISGTASVGKVFVGASGTGTAILTTTGDSDHFTTVTVSGSAVTQGDASVAEGTTTIFDDASDTTSRVVTAVFTQSGNQTKSVDLGVSGEGLAGEQDKATATIQADVYEHASLFTNEDQTLTNGSTVSVINDINSDGGQRAAAVVTSQTTKGAGWSTSAFTNSGTVTETNEINSTVSFNSTNKLNGTHVGSLVVAFADEAGIQGGGSLGTSTWKLSAVVSGNSAAAGVAQVASVLTGNSFAGLNTTGADFNADGVVTKIAIRAGIASADRDLSMTFSNINPGAKDGVANDISRISDIVSLEGTGSDVIVVEMSYMNVANESAAALGWLAGDEWVYATDGNSGAGSLAGAYTMSYDDFLAANGGVFNATTMLGAYGVDTNGNTAWAVINHNSDFAVNTNLATIPEPGTMVLAALGGLALSFRRRSRR